MDSFVLLKDFFSLLVEALDLGRELMKLLDPLVQLLAEQLLVCDDALPNWLLLVAAPAWQPAPRPQAHAATTFRGASCDNWLALARLLSRSSTRPSKGLSLLFSISA